MSVMAINKQRHADDTRGEGREGGGCGWLGVYQKCTSEKKLSVALQTQKTTECTNIEFMTKGAYTSIFLPPNGRIWRSCEYWCSPFHQSMLCICAHKV